LHMVKYSVTQLKYAIIAKAGGFGKMIVLNAGIVVPRLNLLLLLLLTNMLVLSFPPPSRWKLDVGAVWMKLISQLWSQMVVSLVRSDVTVPLKILRDTGAFDSYIVSSVLPFSEETNTGDYILMRGMGLTVLPVLLHKLILHCGLV